MAMYGSVTGVEALNPVVGTLTNSTVPTVSQVTEWLEEGYSIINRTLSSKGYAIPVSTDADVYNELRALNNLYASVNLYTARSLDVITGTDEEKSTELFERFNTQLIALCESDLTDVGVPLKPVDTSTRSRRGIRSLQLRRWDGYAKLEE